MLKKICRCGKIIPYSLKACEECSKKRTKEKKESIRGYKLYNKDRDSLYDKFYKSYEWKSIRQVAIVRDHSLCQDCMKNNKIVPFYTVHHILPIKVHWYMRLDIHNLICLCESCHQKRHSSMKE